MHSPRNIALCLAFAVAIAPAPAKAQKTSLSQKPFPAATRAAIEDALGRKGSPNPGGVLKFGFPRSDLQVVVNGVTVRPAFALGSWVVF
jgi:hypothetical protein